MPKGPRKFHFSFVKTGLTRFGGLSLLQSFCKSLGLRRFLQLYVRWPDYHYRDYHPTDLFLAHLFAIVAGTGRVESTQCLIHNGLIPPILGLSDFPHRDTLRTFLWRFSPKELRSLKAAHDRLRHHFFQQLGLLYRAIIDADTTALITYGSQEGTAVGYIPKRRHGQASYAPIISSEGKKRCEPGDGTQSGQCPRLFWRLGFPGVYFGETPFLDCFHSYPGAARWGVLRQKDRPIPRCKKAGLCHRGQDVPTVEKPHGPSSVPRVFPRLAGSRVYLHPISLEGRAPLCGRAPAAAMEPEEIQKRLFTFKDYTYHRALVTNLELTPEAVWRLYCDRAFQELLLREFKGAYAMAKIPTRSFWANATYMEMILWAYDLVLAFQSLCLPEEVRQWNISTLRRELWCLPAEWVRKDNRNLLMLPAKYPRQDLFLKIEQASEKIKPII
jgi:DDE family transposase